uniref:Uncharacterized protein n=1 Tax=Manihot esculenta TaxID=3983 RepID=A0A2C9ULP3_MANES
MGKKTNQPEIFNKAPVQTRNQHPEKEQKSFLAIEEACR